MRAQRERFTDRLDNMQEALFHVINNTERAYQHIVWSLAKTTKLALDAVDHVIEQEKDASSDIVESLRDYQDVLMERMQRIEGQLRYAEEYHSLPWWKRIRWVKPTCDRGYNTWEDYERAEHNEWIRSHTG